VVKVKLFFGIGLLNQVVTFYLQLWQDLTICLMDCERKTILHLALIQLWLTHGGLICWISETSLEWNIQSHRIRWNVIAAICSTVGYVILANEGFLKIGKWDPEVENILFAGV